MQFLKKWSIYHLEWSVTHFQAKLTVEHILHEWKSYITELQKYFYNDVYLSLSFSVIWMKMCLVSFGKENCSKLFISDSFRVHLEKKYVCVYLYMCMYHRHTHTYKLGKA